MKKLILLFACAVLTLESSQAGLPELEKKIFPNENPSQTLHQTKERLNAHFSTLDTQRLKEALKFCVEEGQLDFVNAYIPKLNGNDLAYLLFFYIKENVGREFVNAQIEKLDSGDRKTLFFNCIIQDVGTEFVNEQITKRNGVDLGVLLFSCAKHNLGTKFLNTQIEKVKVDDLVNLLFSCIKQNVGTDFVNAYVKKLDGIHLLQLLFSCITENVGTQFVNENITQLNGGDLMTLFYNCLKHNGDTQFVNEHITQLNSGDLVELLFLCIKDNVGINFVNSNMKQLETPDCVTQLQGNKLLLSVLKFYANQGHSDVIEKHLINLKGKELVKALWWCACLRQKNLEYITSSDDSLEKFVNIDLLFALPKANSQVQVSNVLNTMKKALQDKNSKIDIPEFFQDLEDLVQQYFKKKQIREDKKAEELVNQIQEMIPVPNTQANQIQGNTKEAISVLNDALKPMDFWALKVQIQYSESEIKEKIEEHLNSILHNTESLFRDEDDPKDQQKYKKEFLDGIKYVSTHIPEAYHAALLCEFEKKSRRIYVSSELQKLLERNLFIQEQEKKKKSVSEKDVMKHFNEKEFDSDKIQEKKKEYTFFSGTFKGTDFVKKFFHTFEIDQSKADTNFDQYVNGILNQTLPFKTGKQNEANIIFQKMNKAIAQHWFSEDALEDLSSPMRLLQRFYQDAVTLGGVSANPDYFPNARCIAGVVTDLRRILSSLSHKANLDYTANLRCKPLN